MPTIRPISDLRNSANEISDFCRQTREPVYITRNGTGDMVVLSMEEYERQPGAHRPVWEAGCGRAGNCFWCSGGGFSHSGPPTEGACPWNSMR